MSATVLTTLPLRTPILDGEAVDSWIEALARRNGTSPQVLLRAVGAHPGLRNTRMLLGSDSDPAVLRRLEDAAGLDTGRLDAAAARTDISGAGILISGRSRFCPQCLDTDQGRWQAIWRSRWQIACPRHRILLRDACPGCGDTPRRILPGGREPTIAGVCTHLVERTRRCGTDLASRPAPPASEELLEIQRWIGLVCDPAGPHSAMTGELPTIVDWLLACDPDGIAATANAIDPARPVVPVHDDGKLKYLDAGVTAVLLGHARTILDAVDRPAIELMRKVGAARELPQRFPPAGLTFQRWQASTGRFPSMLIRAMDPDLHAMVRLRFKSPTAAAGHHVGDTSGRARRIPQMLWADWTARLLPAAGFAPEHFRPVLPILLLVPGSRDIGLAEHARLLNPRISAGKLTVLLQTMAKLPTGSAVTDVIALLCRIADHLDAAGSAIDYQRRRELVPTETITWTQWRDLACSLDAHPGEQAKGRITMAQRFLHEQIVGADLADTRHPMAFRDSGDRVRYMKFLTELAPALRAGLLAHAERLLDDLGIDEPVSWYPPSELADGLALPGIDPADLDTDKIRRLVLDERRLPSDVAELLGIHLEHVRLVLEGLDRPQRQWKKSASPTAWRVDQEAARVLTRAWFDREYLEGQRSLAEIGRDTGFGKHRVARIARQLGVPLRKGRAAIPIDPEWLREQYSERLRPTADIAAELGVEQMTVNDALRRFDIPIRPQGVFSRREFLTTLDDTVPARVKAAVEGQLHGWQRLHRFQIAMAFPNLTTAKAYLNCGTQLTVPFGQLERRLGGPLYLRAEVGRHQQPTPLGQQLLDDLNRPDVQQLMLDALGAKARPMPDDVTLAAARAAVAPPARPKPPRQPKPAKPHKPTVKELAKQASLQRKQAYERIFDGLAVQPVPILSEGTLAILHDLLHAAGPEFHGLAVLHRTGFTEGAVYSALKRFEKAGWLTSRLEDHDALRARNANQANPAKRRTYYRFTSDGHTAAERALIDPQIKEGAKPLRRTERKTVEKPPDKRR